MVDWWQAGLLLLLGAFVGLIPGYFTHRWATEASRKAREHEAEIRVADEKRQVIREIRKERVQPIIRFIETAKRFSTRRTIDQSVAAALQQQDSLVATLAGEKLQESLRSRLDQSLGQIDFFQIMEQWVIAAATASNPELSRRLRDLWDALLNVPTKGPEANVVAAIQATETAIEQYIAGG